MSEYIPCEPQHTSYIWAIVNLMFGNSNNVLWSFRHNDLFLEPAYTGLSAAEREKKFHEGINTATYPIRPQMHKILTELFQANINSRYKVEPEIVRDPMMKTWNAFRNFDKNPYKTLRSDFYESFRAFPAIIKVPHDMLLYCGSIGDDSSSNFYLPISWERDLWEFVFSIITFVDEVGKTFYPDLLFSTASGGLIKACLTYDRPAAFTNPKMLPPRELGGYHLPRYTVYSNYSPDREVRTLNYSNSVISNLKSRPLYMSMGLYCRHPSAKGTNRPKSYKFPPHEFYIGFESDVSGTKIPVFKWGGLIMKDPQSLDLSEHCLECLMLPEIKR